MRLSPEQLERIEAAGGTEVDPDDPTYQGVLATFPCGIILRFDPETPQPWVVSFAAMRRTWWRQFADADPAVTFAVNTSAEITAHKARYVASRSATRSHRPTRAGQKGTAKQ